MHFREMPKAAAKTHGVSPEKTFWGLDAYQKAIDSGVDMVILATPPGFRPLHYKAAIEAGKHVFMEKPCCVDAPGYRSLLETNKLADEKGLKVGVGLQRRHDAGYVNGIQKIHDGKFGDLILLQAYWNGGGIWWRGPQEGWTEMQNQVNNWYHFVWLSGDNICEQHIHNLDVCNWAKDAHPVEANGMGGDADPPQGDIPQDTDLRPPLRRVHLCGRHQDVQPVPPRRRLLQPRRRIRLRHQGTAADMQDRGDVKDRSGVPFKFGNPYQQEHFALVEAIRNNLPYNEGHYGATSSFTAVLGRMATYSGKIIKWDEAVEKGKPEAPGIENYTWDSTPPVVPDEDGRYPEARPGQYNPFA